MDTLLQDLRFGMRQLRRSPAFTLAAVLTLALGIGATTAIFSVVDGVLLKPLPYREPEQLVLVQEGMPSFPRMSVSLPNYLDWVARQKSFRALGAFRTGAYDLTGVDVPERLTARLATSNLLGVLGVQPALGRFFTPEEDTRGGPPVVVLSHAFWVRRFGADARVLGSTLTLDGTPHTVVGVLPEGFRFYSQKDVWVPLSRTEASHFQARGNHPGLYAVGRLAPGVTLAQARADMESIGRALEELYPDSNDEVLPVLAPLHATLVEELRPSLLALVGAVALVLLIAAINVANLLLARGTVRQRELAVRAALGARRGRLVRQLLVESSLLALVGGAGGLLLALWGVDVLARVRPDSIPAVAHFRVDGRVLGFTLALSLGVGVLLGVLPALRASQLALSGTLKESGAGARRFRHRSRDALVVAEVALALVLLVGAGLLLRTFLQLRALDLGFRPQGLLVTGISTPRSRFPGTDAVRAFPGRLVERLSALPGVEGVTYSLGLPLAGFSETSFEVVGAPPPPSGEVHYAAYFVTAPNYFQVMGLSLLEGRGFLPTDRMGSPPVVVVDETLARRFFPDGRALGQRLSFMGKGAEAQVVGVVRHVAAYGPGEQEPAPSQLYFPYAQLPEQVLESAGRSLGLVVRGRGEAVALVAPVREAVRTLDSDQALGELRPMEALLGEALGQRQFLVGLVGLFALLALVLAALGIYGVMSYVVAQRTRELGIRIALGAQGAHILRLVVGHGLLLAGVGVGLGAVVALGLNRLLEGLLSGVGAADPLTFASVAGGLVGVTLLACWLPARRAVRVDPVTSLRAD